MVTHLEIRSIPPLWPGSTIAIVGGGPSVEKVDLGLLFKFKTIGINHAFRLGTDLLWFGDHTWWKENEKDVEDYQGLKATCDTQLPEMPWPDHIKRVRRIEDEMFGIESVRADAVRWNYNSGGSAINVAYHLGAKRILLVGFDMRTIKGKSHFHNYYGKKSYTEDSYASHLKWFDQIAIDASRLGLEIINCTPRSAIKQFPFVQLKDVM